MPTFVSVAALVLTVAAARPAVSQPTPSASPVVVEGTIAMSIEDDFQRGRATRHYFLVQSGRRYDLQLSPRQADAVQPGMTVRVTGRLGGNVLTADPSDESVVVVRPPSVISPGVVR
jgi:hypothetical protein